MRAMGAMGTVRPMRGEQHVHIFHLNLLMFFQHQRVAILAVAIPKGCFWVYGVVVGYAPLSAKQR